MAEYIDKKQLDRKFIIKMLAPTTITIFDVKDAIDKLPIADVIERSEYEKIIEENKALKECITNISNEQLKTAFEIKDSIKEIRKLQEQTRWTEDMKEWDNYNKILSILHKIGGTK